MNKSNRQNQKLLNLPSTNIKLLAGSLTQVVPEQNQNLNQQASCSSNLDKDKEKEKETKQTSNNLCFFFHHQVNKSTEQNIKLLDMLPFFFNLFLTEI